MKKIYMLSALLCASMFSFTGCVEENFEKPFVEFYSSKKWDIVRKAGLLQI